MSEKTDETLEKQVIELRLEVSRLAELLNVRSAHDSADDAHPRTAKANHLSDDLGKFVKFVENYAANEPNKAMGFATALGFIVGLLVSRRRH